MQGNPAPTLDKHRVISIALLNQYINIDSLKTLSLRLKQRFAYFEILLLNPHFEPTAQSPKNKKYAKKENIISPPPEAHTAILNKVEDSKNPAKNKNSSIEALLSSVANVRILEIVSPVGSYENLGSLQYEIFLQNCIGDYLLFMDLSSDSIDDCLAMLTLSTHYDMVIATRKVKPQSLMQKIGSKLFYKTLALFGEGAREDYSEFCVISRKVIHTLLSNHHDIKLLRLLHFDSTLNIYEYPYTPSYAPKRKFLDSLFLGLDIIFGESYKLLRLGTCMCLLLACGNAFYALYILCAYFFTPTIASGWASTSLYMVTMNIGLFLMLSIIGEYVRIVLLKLKNAMPYEIIDEKSSVVLDFQEKNIQKVL
ncbi:hypothetical protein [Helicobacter typhlonius]|uniref:hypothetical protein n=1 Tax=Helicobacter typhlonius TaxID=76936 RepID=UPI002FE0D283